MFCRRTSIVFIYFLISCLCSKHVICATVVPENISATESEAKFSYVVHRLLKYNPLHSFLNSTNEDCRNNAAAILAAAKNLELWALKVADASATVPSGLLQGNVHQFGDIDQCLSAVSLSPPSQTAVPTKYCLAAVDLQSIPYAPVGKLMRSLDIFRSNLSDDTESPEYLLLSLVFVFRRHVLPLTSNQPCGYRPPLSHWMSELKVRYAAITKATSIFALLFFCVASSTIIDVYLPQLLINKKAYQAFNAFSIRRNWRKLISTERPRGDIPVLHGIRAIHVLALLLSHKSVAMLYSPYANRTHMAQITGASWGILGRAAILYTDTFILISGLLTAQSILRELNRSGRVQLVKRVLNRYMRLTPVLVALILWCTLLLPKFSSGPLWGLVVEKHAELCKQYWWRNVLYIHNYYGFENMCLTHTHQLGIDMQLFIVAPALVIPLWLYPRAGLAMVVSLAAASTFLRYVVAYNNELSSLVYFGVPISQMFKTASLSYTLPTHRATVYIFGLVLGWGLSRLPRNYVVPVPVSILGWSFFGLFGVNALLGSYESALPNYVYNVSQAAHYAALAPVMWGAFLTWGIFACVHHAGGILNKIFSWRWFIVVTRLAYSIYLTQFPVFFYNIGVRRHSTSYTTFELLNLPEFSFIIFVSVVLTLVVEFPFQEISDIILKNRGMTTGTQNKVSNSQCNEKEIKKKILRTSNTQAS